VESTGIELEIRRGYEFVSREAAGIVAAKLRTKPDSVFLLPTGATPLGMYRWLVKLHKKEKLTFARATFFNLDEYLGLSPEHRASYHAYMDRNFYCCVDVHPDAIDAPNGTALDLQTECKRYEERIRAAGGVDLCILGIGENGHIGFNEPGTPFDSRTRVVRLTESTRKANAEDFEGSRAPDHAVTVGMRTIYESHDVLLLATGASKAEAVAAAVEGKVTEQVPASMLQHHPHATFVLDHEAATSLTRFAEAGQA
jgi:glucosamine-6-phosphate deaminase